MRPRLLALFVVVAMIGTTSLAAAAPESRNDLDGLDAYVAVVDGAQLEQLRLLGHDLHENHLPAEAGQVAVQLILSPRQRDALVAKGFDLEQTSRPDRGAGARAFSAQDDEHQVWRSYSEEGGIEDEIRQIARDHPRLVKLVKIGESIQGQDILALKLTRNARNVEDGRRPAVLYLSMQHAREWITVEMTRRLLHHYLDNYGRNPTITRLVNDNELWFVLVANPDGYDFTFTEGNRQWRKNLRDNNGDGEITNVDGVDLNRNFSTNWGYDNEGSSDDPASETYRGTAPSSEPETRALDDLMARVGFEFLINYHSAAELLLYGVGWQVESRTPDDEIYEALVGDDRRPAVPGYDPDLSAELYITNGDTTDHAHIAYGTLAFTPEMSTCQTVAVEGDPDCESVFTFPDDEERIEAEFRKNLPFALDVARSAEDPANPSSHLGLESDEFRVDTFDVSYGDRQLVSTWVQRDMGRVRLRYRINGGRIISARTQEWRGGERYGDTNNVYYREMRGRVTGTQEGDLVEVWFTAGGRPSEHFTYRVVNDSDADVLVLVAEDYTGLSGSPAPTGQAEYLEYYTDALDASGIDYDVYDIDERGRQVPHPLGVLSHYDAVIWYTGDDVVWRDQGQGPGRTTKLAWDLPLAVRDFLNEGGKLLYTGKYAGLAESGSAGSQYFGLNQDASQLCPPDVEGEFSAAASCLTLTNDFHQYWLGAHTYGTGGGLDSDGNPMPVEGTDTPFTDLLWGLDGGDSAGNQGANPPGLGPASLIPTSNVLPEDEFPQFHSWRSARYAAEGAAPYEPLTGDWLIATQQADTAYKRLSRTVDLTGADSGSLTFNTSYDIESNWDFLFVEARPVGTDDWTTLPDANGHTTQETGDSCLSDWTGDLHPHLAHYQTLTPGSGDTEDSCAPTGTSGEWHAATGTSQGWEEWNVDLSAYAGQQVEVSVTYATDWAFQGLGVFVDDATVVVGEDSETSSFETEDLGGWTVPGPPEGTEANSNDWIRTQTLFDVAAAVTTPDSVYLGFGFEGISTEAERNTVMERAMEYLLP